MWQTICTACQKVIGKWRFSIGNRRSRKCHTRTKSMKFSRWWNPQRTENILLNSLFRVCRKRKPKKQIMAPCLQEMVCTGRAFIFSNEARHPSEISYRQRTTQGLILVERSFVAGQINAQSVGEGFGCSSYRIWDKECRILGGYLLHEFRVRWKTSTRNESKTPLNAPHKNLESRLGKFIAPLFNGSNRTSTWAWIQQLNAYISLSLMYKEEAIKFWSFNWKVLVLHMNGGIMA